MEFSITMTTQGRTTHQKYRLFQSKLLNTTFNNTCAECDDTSLQKKDSREVVCDYCHCLPSQWLRRKTSIKS